jgi:DNA-binding XRE family transcriptional regulator
LPASLKCAETQADTARMAGSMAAAAMPGGRRGGAVPTNNVQRFRESLMMSKAELARKAGLSTLTIDRVESGRPCRLDTKRKILIALGLRVTDKDQLFSARADALSVTGAIGALATRASELGGQDA